MSIRHLNAEYGIEGSLRFVEGPGGFPVAEVDNGLASARICTYAGQVLSYRPAGEPEDLLFVSRQAHYVSGKAIRGGIPVCWPWFGPHPQGLGGPAHGLVRTRRWEVLGTWVLRDGGTRIRLGVRAEPADADLWPEGLGLELEVDVGRGLALALVTRNASEAARTLTQALHTYLRVGEVGQARVLGLEGKGYIDKLQGGAEGRQSGPVVVAEEVDRIYTGVDADLTLDDQALGRRIRIAPEGSASAVVWNPWAQKAAAMADLGDDEYRTLLCVETTNAGPDAVCVPAGGEHRLAVRYAVQRGRGQDPGG
jgi:glucose-6-phosphate 1-epimerase